jgi:phenylacetate-CoA ligase
MIDQVTELARLLHGRLPSADELEAIRERKLRALIRHAYEHIPFYRARFMGAGITPDDVRSVDDLRRVPIVTRDELQAAGADARATGVDLACSRVARTSGSSGKPLAVFRTFAEDRLRRALEFRSMRWAGLRLRDRIVNVGTTHALPRSPLRYLGLCRLTLVPPSLPIDEQIARVRRLQPDVLWIYPTALRALLSRIGSLQALARPRTMVTSAEPLDPVLRRRVSHNVDVEFLNFYGSVESGRIAWECPAHEGLHINADCVILELAEDTELPDAGSSVLVTNLNSFAMPFIRYRLGDRCELLARPCSCGAPLPLMKPPVGRDWDVVALPSGKLLSPWGIHPFLRELDALQQFRFTQERINYFVLQLVLARPVAADGLATLRRQLLQHLGEPVTLDIEVVDAIEAGPLKFRTFISKVGADKVPRSEGGSSLGRT